jgi:hypothetical protein
MHGTLMSAALRHFAYPLLLLGCSAATPDTTAPTTSGSYLFVWAGADTTAEQDFLAVIDADTGSAHYGQIVASVAAAPSAGAHHSEHVMPAGDTLLVNAFGSGMTYLMDVSDPLAPRVAGSFGELGGFSHPHSYSRLPNGNTLMTYQMSATDHAAPGGLVEIDASGALVRASASAADPVDPELKPYSVTVFPELDRAVSTTTDMHGQTTGSSFQVWRLSDLALLKTVKLPTGPRGQEQNDPAEVRVMDNGTVILTTFRCGMYRLTGIDSDAPSAEFIHGWDWATYDTDDCSLAVSRGDFWVQAVTNANGSALVTLDLRDPLQPVEVARLTMPEAWSPHWLSMEPSGNRIVITSGNGATLYRVLVVRFDPSSGTLAIDSTFRDPGSNVPGVSFDRTSWPHGAAGRAKPHGAVFSR